LANQDPIQKFLESQRLAFVFSAYQIWAEHRGVSEYWSGGVTDYWNNEKVGDKLLFDIGSMTKAVVTGSVLARAVDRKQLDLGETVGKYLPSTPYSGLTLHSLLSHSSGLAAWLPFHQTPMTSVSAWLAQNSSHLFPTPKPTKSVYSDVGFWILGLVIEKIWGDIKTAFETEVKKPLALRGVQFGPVTAAKAVATEFREERRAALRGIVFDENCEAMGGTAAHAGLFATAFGVASWARHWLDARKGRTQWLSAKTAEIFTKVAVPTLGSWGLGWDTKSETGSSAGSRFSPNSFGHLGYPGTSVWIDPDSDAFLVTLTNRVHPSRLDERVRVFRPQFHDLMHSRWEGSKNGAPHG